MATLGTFWIETQEDGNISIGVEDYDVEFFGGGDHEMIYTLDPENISKMESLLSKTWKTNLEEMITEEFGIHLAGFGKWLDENDIKYKYFTWTTYD